jgi:hypothetical protein
VVSTALITTEGTVGRSSDASINATAALDASGVVGVDGSASIQAQAGIVTEGYVAKAAAAQMVATGTIDATGEVRIEVGAQIHAVATISTDGVVIDPSMTPAGKITGRLHRDLDGRLGISRPFSGDLRRETWDAGLKREMTGELTARQLEAAP